MEFALVLPILLLFVLGIVELGFLLNQSLVVTAAARDGARAAATGGTDTNIITAAKQSAASIDKGSLVVSITPATRVSGQPATVTVTNPVPLISPLFSAILGGDTFTVRGTSTMRVQ